MTFTNKITVERFNPSPSPVLPGSEKGHYDRELRNISRVILTLTEAVKEIQDYLKTLP